jgi:hypothetical protein
MLCFCLIEEGEEKERKKEVSESAVDEEVFPGLDLPCC